MGLLHGTRHYTKKTGIRVWTPYEVPPRMVITKIWFSSDRINGVQVSLNPLARWLFSLLTLPVVHQYCLFRAGMIVDGWFHERGELWPGQAMSLEIKEVLDHHRSKFQDLLVFESTNNGKVLVLDGVIQVTERDEFAYQEMIAHIPLFAHPNPKRVLVIGGGDGGVLREIAKHSSVEQMILCEIDKDVIEASKKYFPEMAKGFADPRVTVEVMDGAEFLAAHRDSFDVIITDSSDPVGPASVLFETPFYNAMYASLREGGIVCTQGECVWLHVDLIKPLIKSISRLYSTVEYAYTTIPTYPSGQIGFIIATKGRDKCSVPARAPSGDTEAALKYYTSELHTASFVLPAFARRAIFEA